MVSTRQKSGWSMARSRKDPRRILLKNVEADAETLKGLNGGTRKRK